jgi:alcohol dehydrogenase
MLFQIQVLFFRFIQFCLKIGTYIIPFRIPETFSGAGASLQLCEAIARTGVKKVLVVTDAMLVQIGLVKPIQDKLQALGIAVVTYDGVKPDPTIEQIEAGVDRYKREGCEAIVAVGGGSSIDAAKVIAARARNPHGVRWMAGLFRLLRSPAPLYAVPTTAGTGSEVTIAAVVSDPENMRKFAIMDFRLVPQMAALDGGLMTGIPPAITAATGMDALTHAVEAYISRNRTRATDVDALEAVALVMEHLPKVMDDGSNLASRSQMAVAAYKAGLAFTKAGVGYVHAIAHNFGAHYHIPHGLANAIILPYVLEYSKPNCVDRLATLAVTAGLGQRDEPADALADRFIARIRELNARFGIPTTVDKLRAEDIPAIAANARSEANWYYAVPRYMDRETSEHFIAQMLPA